LSELHKMKCGGEPQSRGDSRREVEEPLNQALRSLTSRLGNSTVGVALFDKRLQCEALNSSFACMNGLPIEAQVGKNIHQLFGKEAAKLESAFRGVLDTGERLSNFEWIVRCPASTETSRWHVNFYPIKDVSGQIRLVAATFSEVTKRSSVEPPHG
jgi:PAS domain-containing protein